MLELEKIHDSSFGWALWCCNGNRDRAEDVLQDVYVKILEGKAVYGGRSGVKTWVFSIIRLTAAEHRRRIARGLRIIERFRRRKPDSGSLSEDDVYGSALKNSWLRDAIRKLSVRQREILHLVFYQGMTIEDAAPVMGISAGSARTHYHRAKERLRKFNREEQDV